MKSNPTVTGVVGAFARLGMSSERRPVLVSVLVSFGPLPFRSRCRTHGSAWRRRSELNRRIQLLQSRALPLGYSAHLGAKQNRVPPPRKRKLHPHPTQPSSH